MKAYLRNSRYAFRGPGYDAKCHLNPFFGYVVQEQTSSDMFYRSQNCINYLHTSLYGVSVVFTESPISPINYAS